MIYCMEDLDKIKSFSKDFLENRFMAVVGSVFEGESRTFICWYVYLNNNIYWKSRTSSEHSQAFAKNKECSLCVYDHQSQYPDNKTGIQVLGEVEKVTDLQEMEILLKKMESQFGGKSVSKNKIEDLLDPNTSSTFYRFSPKKFKLVCKSFDLHMEHYDNK
jgi:nitroimidazol reductase NimA-like FMN-containing flavoprotein (pyridoxamine 5'-phosphate oxidase superfamily)